MKEKIISLVGNNLDSYHMWIDDVFFEQEDGQNYLSIVLDAERVLTIDEVVMATRILNPIIDKNLKDEEALQKEYILNVYAKEKGDV